MAILSDVKHVFKVNLNFYKSFLCKPELCTTLSHLTANVIHLLYKRIKFWMKCLEHFAKANNFILTN